MSWCGGRCPPCAGTLRFRYVEKVIELAMDGQVDATVTNAFNKEAVNLAGHHYFRPHGDLC